MELQQKFQHHQQLTLEVEEAEVLVHNKVQVEQVVVELEQETVVQLLQQPEQLV
jgi:hypothetical protein|tara:strand:- start:128 stop:289 length:162 start_codon:yes stop_codon:yes gene_type:complete